MKRKSGRKSQNKPEDDSNGLKEVNDEENGGGDSEVESDIDVDDEPQNKKRKSTKSSKKNVSFSKKHDKSLTETDDEAVKKPKEKKKKKDSKVEDDQDEDDDKDKDDQDEDEDDDSQYEVEKVLDEKLIRGVRHYLIRWKGYDEESDTWEQEDGLNCKNLIEAFKLAKKKNKPKKAGRKIRKEDTEEWDENEDFEVDKILEVHFRKDGKREFFVSWKGYGSKYNSWEPEENMSCQDMIARFMAKVEKARSFDDRELRMDRKRVNRLTYNTPDSNRRLSKRNSGRERVQYHDTE